MMAFNNKSLKNNKHNRYCIKTKQMTLFVFLPGVIEKHMQEVQQDRYFVQKIISQQNPSKRLAAL